MPIWVDADACPKPVREILFRAAERARVPLTLVANQHVRTPPSRYVRSLQVAAGFDVADNEIVRRIAPGDLVITGDIPLAAAVVDKGGHALSPRGEEFTEDNVKERLAMRDLMDQLRSTGLETGGPAALDKSDRQAFANALDRFLTENARRSDETNER
ncbi:MAG TPA: YaiI/YqxD family protein [Gammaproteobacteria bacterium]